MPKKRRKRQRRQYDQSSPKSPGDPGDKESTSGSEPLDLQEVLTEQDENHELQEKMPKERRKTSETDETETKGTKRQRRQYDQDSPISRKHDKKTEVIPEAEATSDSEPLDRDVRKVSSNTDGHQGLPKRYEVTNTSTQNLSSDEEERFGQKTPPLTVYLQRILEKYPDGGQILKELVQNADDAAATNVIFMYDKTDYPSDLLYSKNMTQFQGPALYAYNDGVFTEKDWYNIQNPEQSGKKDEPTKVGRFGLGFNSVYHLTDLPSIMSGQRIGFLDPREKCFGEGEKGKSWKINSNRFHQYQDQLKPFKHQIFKSDEDVFQNGEYPGTIFRFPLRKEESELSKTLYDEDRMEELFSSYQIDAEISLLFLKSVQSVSLYEKTSDGTPLLRYQVRIAEKDITNVRRDREQFVNGCRAMADDVQSDTDFQIERFHESQTHVSRYITVNLLKLTNISEDLRELIKDCNLKLLPWVSVTIPVNAIKMKDRADHELGKQGRVFCFLPLPSDVSPGFPIHVHGYFGLNDNRRGIKWPDGESTHDKQAKWNQQLIHEVFPEAYAKLLLQSIETTDMEIPDNVYACWPSIDDKRHPIWNEGINALVKRIQDEQILYSEVDGGKWMAPRDVLLNSESKTACSNLLQKVLLQKGLPVVKLPTHVMQTLILGGVAMTEVSPTHVRKAIRKDPLNWLNSDEKLELLEYVLSDDQLDDLNDICLLPLRDGAFDLFSKSLPDVYIPTEDTPAVIIPNLNHRFTADTLPLSLRSEHAQSCTQLIQFNVEHVVELLHEALPRNWVKGPEAKVAWQPGENNHPGSDWLQDIWTWLSQNYHNLPLIKLTDIPLLPLQTSTEGTSSLQLVRLQPNTVIFEKSQHNELETDSNTGNGQEIPSCICSFLEELGIVVVCHILQDFVRDHPEIHHIIQPPNPEGVCEILVAKDTKHVVKRMNDLSPEDKNHFRNFFSELTLRTVEKYRNFLVKLPMFPDTCKNYVSVSHCNRIIPKDFNGIPVSHFKDVFICVGDENSRELLRKLKCHEILEEELLRTFILPQVSYPSSCYNDDEILRLMEWVLERSQYDNDVKSVNFIPTANGKKSSPQHLFDPYCQDLRLLFPHSSVFPTGKYLKKQLLEKIRRVGFRKESSITATELLEVSSDISNNENKDNSPARAKILLEYINRSCHLLKQQITYNKITKPFASFLEDKTWVPVVPSAAAVLVGYPGNLAWFGNQHSLHKPREVAPCASALLQGSIVPLVDLKGVSRTLAEAFGWHRELDYQNYVHVERVVCHLKNVCTSYHIDSDDSVYTKVISEIYGFLSQAPSKHIQSAMETKLDDVSWVWHGRGFTTSDRVAFDGGSLRVKLDPYLFVLPKSMKTYQQFLSGAGVQERFPKNVLCSVLASIQKTNDSGNRSQAEVKDDLSLVCDILNCIANSLKASSRNTDILVPTRDDGNVKYLKLVETHKCLYVDDERLLDEYARSDCELPVVHQIIPTETAKQLGLLRLSHYVAPTEAIDLGYDMEGPHETTVNAIRRNLELYKEGLDIFKELIQNADDAGATEVKFLIDWRANDDAQQSMLNEGMKSCHGPALWAFNNAQFTETDVKNISNIAAATKKRELEKVGRFGLGFTSVYHLTDVPSVVSGPFIMIFDPRTTHLRERVTPAKPGIKLDLRNNKHKVTVRSFSDQFQPFKDVFGCNVLDGDGYQHTLFRLPLRSEREVRHHAGEILSDAVYQSKEKIEDLLRVFRKSTSSLLLFTQNIETLSVHVLEDGKSPDLCKEVLSVSVNRKKQLTRSIHKGPNGNLRTERNLLRVAAKYLPNLPEQDSGPNDPDVTNGNVESSMILEIQVKDNEAGKRKAARKSVYCVSSCMSKGAALTMAQSKDGRRAGILPCGGVAALLVNGYEGLEPSRIEGQTFSFLPLDIFTGLPFHINGTFLLQPNRRQLWSKTSSTKDIKEEEFEIQWNICLMIDVICKAFLNLLNDLKNAQEMDIVNARSFQTLWPTTESVHSDFQPIVNTFYEMLCGEQNPSLKVIHNGNRWISLSSVVFTVDITEIPTVKVAVNTLINQHCRPNKIIPFETSVYKSMQKSGVLQCFDQNTFTWSRFIERVFFPLVKSEDDSESTIEPNHRDNIIQHLLDERIGSSKVRQFDELLCTAECIPVSEDLETLVTPCRLVHPERLAGKLFHKGNMRFPNGDGYLKAERLLSLTELGMTTDTLDWEDICERSETIQSEENFDVPSFQRSVVLLGIIDQKLKERGIGTNTETDTLTPEQRLRIQNSRFLPVMNQEESYPFAWYENGINFYRAAADIYEAKFINIVGSVRGILDEKRLGSDVITDRLKEFLGVKNKEPLVEDAVEQLLVIMNEDINTDKHSTVVKICGDIYDFLQRKVCLFGQENQVLPEPRYLPQIEQLRCTKFLFTDGKFVESKQLAFRFKSQCSPFLYSVPNILTPYTNLLRICGVREEFQPRDFIEVVAKLRDHYQGNSMTDNDITLAHAMLQYVIDAVSTKVRETFKGDLESEEGVSKSNECFLQILEKHIDGNDKQLLAIDHDGILQETTDLTFNDMWWLEDHTFNTTHLRLTLHNARVLEIPTARERSLHDCFTLDGFEIESNFGQTEHLTDRLKTILRDYHHVSDVMKELLQNADDAKATEIHFVYDARSHKSEKIIHKKWEVIQKLPALCVYNNSQFSKEDILGIQKVGVGGKLHDRSTAGRFGVGFNAVYHLTDCPTFITNNEKICIFDPQVQYVPGATSTRPGGMFYCSNAFQQKFPDMLEGYLGDKFALKGATMFRFPLRSHVMADTSRISSDWYDDHKVKRLMKEFEKIAKDSLFFLKYIEDIHISVIEKDGSLQKLYEISSKIDAADKDRRQKLTNHIEKYKDSSSHILPMTQVYRLDIKDTDGLDETWMVSQSVGFEEPLKSEEDMQQRGLKHQIPRGGVAALIRSKESLSDRNSRWHMKRRVYSFLPLPIESKLPVHVNGSFALDSSRRHLAKSTGYFAQGDGSETSLAHPWNRHIVQQVITAAYAHLIKEAKVMVRKIGAKISENHIEAYYSLFPSYDYGDWNVLAKHALSYIAKHEMEVLPVVDENHCITWHQPDSKRSQAFFDDLQWSEKLIRSFLLSTRFKLVKGPLDVRKAFVNANVKSACVTPQEILNHLSTNVQHVAPVLPCTLQGTCFKSLDCIKAVTQYCLKPTSHQDFNRVPLRLTNDGKLNLFSPSERVYLTTFFDLLPGQPEMFIHESLLGILQSKEDMLLTNRVIHHFGLLDLAQYIHLYLPKEWQDEDKHVNWTPGKNGHPAVVWLQRLWDFIFTCEESNPTIRWPIIPTTTSKLVLPRKAKTVLYLGHYSSFAISNILSILQCPVLDTKVLRTTGNICSPYLSPEERARTNFLQNTLASLENREEVLGMFEYVLEERSLEGILSIPQAHGLLTYFQTAYQTTKKKRYAHLQKSYTLKRLPLFLTVDGKLSSINGYRNCHTCSCRIPMDEDFKWKNKASCIFLQPNAGLKLLYTKLDITSIGEIDIYTRYILPNFNLMSQEAREVHMVYIRDHILQSDNLGNVWHLLNCLRSVDWIPDNSGSLKKASFFYDPTIDVFRTMVDPCKLLPEKFASSPFWLDFLGKFGLNRNVTDVLFLQYAREIEIHASCITQTTARDALIKKTKALLTELKKNVDLKESAFIESLSRIKFIPPVSITRELTNILPAYQSRVDGSGGSAFISFSEGIPSSDMKLAWSVAMVLPSYADIRKDGKRLGMNSKMAQSCIAQHIKNVCNKMVKWNCCDVEDRVQPETRRTLNGVMCAVLEYLQMEFNHDTLVIKDFKGIPICLVDNNCVLVRAEQMVFQMSNEDQFRLRPHLYKAPDQMSRFKSILVALGAQPKPTLKQLAFVLSSIEEMCGRNEMHPNEMATAHTAVMLIFRELINGCPCHFDTDVLYLPTTHGYLKQSKSLCCADSHLKKNLPETLGFVFVVELRQCGIDDPREDTKLLALLPEELRPYDLGDSIIERPCSSNNICRAGRDCLFLENIRRCLLSEELQRALMRLLRHEREGARLNAEHFKKIERLKEVRNLTCVEQLNIELIGSNGNCLSEQPRERMVFSKFSESGEPHIYLHHSDLPVVDCLLYRELAQTIARVCNITMDSEHFLLLREVIACTSLDNMNLILTKADIPEYDDESETSADPFAPGTVVPQKFAELLDANPYNRFQDGETVAYALPVQLADVAFSFEELDEDWHPPGQEYVFARIIREDSSSGRSKDQLGRKYFVDVGRELPERVGATTLYKFRRYKISTDRTEYTADEENTEEPRARGGLPVDNVDEAQDWIKHAVEEAYTLPEDERKTALRRLRFMWHPDKNRMQTELATVGFQFLQQEINRKENPQI